MGFFWETSMLFFFFFNCSNLLKCFCFFFFPSHFLRAFYAFLLYVYNFWKACKMWVIYSSENPSLFKNQVKRQVLMSVIALHMAMESAIYHCNDSLTLSLSLLDFVLKSYKSHHKDEYKSFYFLL